MSFPQRLFLSFSSRTVPLTNPSYVHTAALNPHSSCSVLKHISGSLLADQRQCDICRAPVWPGGGGNGARDTR